MKLKVVREFLDRYTKKLHKVGEEFEADEKRFNEIQRVGNLVERVDDESIEEETTDEVADEKPAKTKKK